MKSAWKNRNVKAIVSLDLQKQSKLFIYNDI